MTAEVTLLLDNFAAKTEEQHDEELKRRSLHLVNSRRQPRTVAPLKIALAVLAVIAVASVMIYSRVVLTELTEDANSYTTKISELNTEYNRLEAELEAKTSIKAIAEAAEKDLGLSKIDSGQVEYVNLTDSDDIAVAESRTESIKKTVLSFWERVTGFFS